MDKSASCYEACLNILNRLDRIEGYLEIEDRVTASDVLCRLTKLEEAYTASFETAKEIIFQGAQTHASILKCEAKYKELEKMNRKPHKCPVCEGHCGTIINGVIDEDCRSCEGKGIVWG